MHRFAISIVCAASCVLPSRALAQAPLGVAAGTKIFVTDRGGAEARGTLTAVTADTIQLDTAAGPRTIAWRDVDQIAKKDSNRNGFWIGAAIGGLIGLATVRGHRDGVWWVLGHAIGPAGTGALIDNYSPGRQTVYRRPPAAAVQPIVDLGARAHVGVAATVTWR